MSKVFEDYFTDIQADMVSICLEYIENQGDSIYIYCSSENKVYSVGYFYKVNGQVKERHKINEALPNADISIVCKQFELPMPTEMKIVYDIKKNSFDASYQYDLIYSNDREKTADDIEKEWFEEIVKKNNQD